MLVERSGDAAGKEAGSTFTHSPYCHKSKDSDSQFSAGMRRRTDLVVKEGAGGENDVTVKNDVTVRRILNI
jgi:hypothetical protein|tara:strand:- start:172 stop:384 length:213 start_codon:yes stop_codon:yes gene_type:complete